MRNPFENISLRDLQVTFDADLMEEAMQLHLDVQVEDMELDDEGTLRGYPLCQNARIVIRRGSPGSQEREVFLGS